MREVIKRRGQKEEFSIEKTLSAIEKASFRTDRANRGLSDSEREAIKAGIQKRIENEGKEIPVDRMHVIVESTLYECGYLDILTAYSNFRNYKREWVSTCDSVLDKERELKYQGDRSNANTNSALVSTKRSILYGEFNKEMYRFLDMTPAERLACKEGYIYRHDQSAARDTFNCQVVDAEEIMTGGFEMANIWYNEPKSLDVGFDVLGDLIQSNAAQQYGGYTVPQVDNLLSRYAEKSYNFYYQEFIDMGATEGTPEEYAWKKTVREAEQGYQGIEIKLNTVSSCRGDYPFTTFTFGLPKNRFAKMIAEVILRVHQGGQGRPGFKKPVLFPKLVFLFDWNRHAPGNEDYDLFRKAIICSSKTMYPDYQCLTGNNLIGEMYKQGGVVSPMGCHAYGTPIIMADGTIKEVQDVVVGDRVMGADGTPRNVLELVRGYSNMYLINQSQAESYVVNEDHILSLKYLGKKKVRGMSYGDIVNITVKEFLDLPEWIQKRLKGYKGSYDLTEKEFKIPPYILGLWLGDGECSNPHILVNRNETQLIEDIERYAHSINHTMNVTEEGEIYRVRICNPTGHKGKKNEFLQSLKDLDVLNNKHIPEEYFLGSKRQREELLAGLINTDGWSRRDRGRSTVCFGNTNYNLIAGAKRIADSLGLRTNIVHARSAGVGIAGHQECNIKDYWHLNISGFDSEILMNHKRPGKSSGKRDFTTSVISVEKLEKDNYYGFNLDGDQLYLFNDCTVTHNCRSMVSPWYERGGMFPADEDDKIVTVGRNNVGVVSLNLPMIFMKSKEEGRPMEEVLTYYLDMCVAILLRTFDYLSDFKASCNPLSFCEGGLWHGHLNPDDRIEPVLRQSTASIGVTALNELQVLYNGKKLSEDNSYAIYIMEFINKYVDEAKLKYGRLFSVYGTPAEMLASKQVQQFRAKYGIIKGVSDREYFSNSFHCHVSEDITPFEKQDKEFPFWELFKGGRIQYCKHTYPANIKAIEEVVLRAMEMGYYEGVNISLSYCESCGYSEPYMTKCTQCGSDKLTMQERVCGYMGYYKVEGETRLNDGKIAEINDRVSM